MPPRFSARSWDRCICRYRRPQRWKKRWDHSDHAIDYITREGSRCGPRHDALSRGRPTRRFVFPLASLGILLPPDFFLRIPSPTLRSLTRFTRLILWFARESSLAFALTAAFAA